MGEKDSSECPVAVLTCTALAVVVVPLLFAFSAGIFGDAVPPPLARLADADDDESISSLGRLRGAGGSEKEKEYEEEEAGTIGGDCAEPVDESNGGRSEDTVAWSRAASRP